MPIAVPDVLRDVEVKCDFSQVLIQLVDLLDGFRSEIGALYCVGKALVDFQQQRTFEKKIVETKTIDD